MVRSHRCRHERNTLNAGMDRANYEIERREVRAPVDGPNWGDCDPPNRPPLCNPAKGWPPSFLRAGSWSRRIPLQCGLWPNPAGTDSKNAARRFSMGGVWRRAGHGFSGRCRNSRRQRPRGIRNSPHSGFSRGKLEHGMPGTVDVAVEHVTPGLACLANSGRVADGTPMTRRFFVPEVVQTSAMDCGPASLKALFGGFGIISLMDACEKRARRTSMEPRLMRSKT